MKLLAWTALWLALVVALASCDDDSSATSGDSSGPGASASSSAAQSSGASSSSTGGAGGAGGSTGMGGGGSGGVGGEPDLTNTTAGCGETDVYPKAGEEGHRAAARLTPPSWPFTITKIRYRLWGQNLSADCQNAIAHSVDIFTSTDVTPPATPVPLAHFDVPADVETRAVRVVDLDLEPEIVLADGEHLFIAVEMTGSSPSVLCVDACQGDDEADRNWWSAAPSPPYPWAQLADYGIHVDYRFDAFGHP